MLFTNQIFKNSQYFPRAKKLSRVFVSKQTTKIFKHSAKHSVEILMLSEEIKSWFQCLKNLATCLSYNTWLSYLFFQSSKFFLGHIFILFPFSCLCKKLLNTCKKENANANLEKVDTMLFEKLKQLPANKMYTSFEIWLVFSTIFVKFNDNPNNNQLYRWWQFSLSQDLVVFILRSF